MILYTRPLRAFIVGLITVVVFSAICYLQGPPLGTTTGVVESIKEPATDSRAWPKVATVRLRDGSLVQAAVVHDCNPSPGQFVRVHMSRGWWGRRLYYIVYVMKDEDRIGQLGKRD
jgi:hypothetical protein